MHSLPKMRSFLHSPPVSLLKSSPPARIHLLRLPTISEKCHPLSKDPIFKLPNAAISASRSHCSSQIDAGQLYPVANGKRVAPFGEIHVIFGPMFAGKTTALLHRIQLEGSNGRKYALIKSNKDNRYGLDCVVTHDGVKMPCWALSKLSAFRAVIGEKAYEELDVIGIDEAQFFEDLYDFCQRAADHDGKIIFVAGLDGDYLRCCFGSVMDIIPLADSVMKLTARCQVCGNPAFFTLRKTPEKRTEVIGGADIYMPVCRQHYLDGQSVIETTRLVVLESQKVHCHEEAHLPS